jgi:hypothetical protein
LSIGFIGFVFISLQDLFISVLSLYLTGTERPFLTKILEGLVTGIPPIFTQAFLKLKSKQLKSSIKGGWGLGGI